MGNIETFQFGKKYVELLKKYRYGLNWPVVYLQEDGKEMYIGQTTNLYSRSKQHFENPDRARLKRVHVLTDEEFNLSTTFDFESLLIQYVSADGMFKLQNGNGGLINHNYYDRERYIAKLETLWPLLQEKGLVKKELADIRNSDLFKYSPFKALTEEQFSVVAALEKSIIESPTFINIVSGAPGTGKTIVALYLLKLLKSQPETKDISVALVVPMTSLRDTLQRVLQRVPGLGADMVIGPADVVKKKYDLLLVDEAHRLRRRVNLANFGSYDDVNRKLQLPKDATQLDWITTSAKQVILFYDRGQSVIPGDVRPADFKKLAARHFELTSQMRVKGGEDYLAFVDDLLSLRQVKLPDAKMYDFRLYDDVGGMIDDIKSRESEHKLSRLVAGYAWPWKTKSGDSDYDIEIDGIRLTWNSTNTDWANSKNAVNEVGCIHTIQGYDLNYAGVIVGPELTLNEAGDELIVDETKYKDINGKRSISHPDELKQYVVNIYKTLLSRGILGTYVYIVDRRLREKMRGLLGTPTPISLTSDDVGVLSPVQLDADMISVPLVGYAPCGGPIAAPENIEGEIQVPKSKLRPGASYFVIQAVGDSMNLAGITDGDLLLCRAAEKADTGDRVIAILGGENVTVKVYGPRENGVRLLLPKSTNKSHLPITPGDGDSVQGIVQEVLPSDS